MSSWTGHQVVDPVEMQSRFSLEDSIANVDFIFTERSEESERLIEKVRGIMENLPPLEADFVDLYFFKGVRQTVIADIFGVSQPTVCYRLQRATYRIQFMLRLPDVTVEEIYQDLAGILPEEPLDLEIMALMFQTTCQSEVAKRLGVSQGLVRHRFIRALERLRDVVKYLSMNEYEKYVELFGEISQNLNTLREVRRASDNKITCVID